MPRPSKDQDLSTFAGQVASIVRQKRTAKNLTVPEAAERAGVPVQTWYTWESGRHLPLESLPTIANALKARLRDLLPAAWPTGGE